MTTENTVKKNMVSIERFSRHAERTIRECIPIIKARFPEALEGGDIDMGNPKVQAFLAEPKPKIAERYFVAIDSFCRALGIPRTNARDRLLRMFGQSIDGDRIDFLDPLVAAYVREIPPLAPPRAQHQTVEAPRRDGMQIQRADLRPDPQAKRVEAYSNDPGPNDQGWIDLVALAKLIRGEISEMPGAPKPRNQTIDRTPDSGIKNYNVNDL